MQRKQSILDTNAQCFETFACSKSSRVIEKGESRMETSRDCTVDGPEVPNPIRSTLRESRNFNSVSKLSWRPNKTVSNSSTGSCPPVLMYLHFGKLPAP